MESVRPTLGRQRRRHPLFYAYVCFTTGGLYFPFHFMLPRELGHSACWFWFGWSPAGLFIFSDRFLGWASGVLFMLFPLLSIFFFNLDFFFFFGCCGGWLCLVFRLFMRKIQQRLNERECGNMSDREQQQFRHFKAYVTCLTQGKWERFELSNAITVPTRGNWVF